MIRNDLLCPYGNQLQLFHCFSLQEVSLKRSRCLTLEFAMNKDVNYIIAVVSSQGFYSVHLPLFFLLFLCCSGFDLVSQVNTTRSNSFCPKDYQCKPSCSAALQMSLSFAKPFYNCIFIYGIPDYY